MKIWVNTIVNNEENFVWFAIMSVVDYVDKVLVWDTGSTDKTVEIIKKIILKKGNKIEFRQVGYVDKDEFTKTRQAMLNQSKCDWILILDGDEIWWEDSIRKLKNKIEQDGDKLDAIAVPFYNLVGDIYHYQAASAGRYKLMGQKGHLTLRAVNRNIPGLHWSKPYGQEGLYDGNNISIQDEQSHHLVFLDSPFLHLTHLKRSSIHNPKFKYDSGISFPKDFKYPEVFYKERLQQISSPWSRRTKGYEAISLVKKPIQSLWRKIK